MVFRLRVVIMMLLVAAALATVWAVAPVLGQNAATAPPTQTSTSAAPIASVGVAAFANNCAVCHGADGKGTAAGPSLETVNDAAVVAQTVRSGKGTMPSFAGRLSDAEIGAVADYVAGRIATVTLTGGNLTRGGNLYRLNCAGCHSTTGRGGALVDVGQNAPALTGLAPAQIATGIRSGPGPMPPFPQTVFNQQDLASIVSYVQMLQNPDTPGGYPLGFRGPVTEGLVAIVILGALCLVAVWIERKGRG